jgi:hypothetical protein
MFFPSPHLCCENYFRAQSPPKCFRETGVVPAAGCAFLSHPDGFAAICSARNHFSMDLARVAIPDTVSIGSGCLESFLFYIIAPSLHCQLSSTLSNGSGHWVIVCSDQS